MTTESADVYETGDLVATGDEKPRKLDDLLRLPSYQGMTDDEIRLVIAYKVMNAYNVQRIKHEQELNEARIAEIAAQAKIARESSEADFKRALDLVPSFESVGEA